MKSFGNMNMTPRNKLIAGISIILFFSFIGLSFLNYMITRESVHNEILENDLPLTRDNIYSEIISELRKPVLVATSMANDTFLKDWTITGEVDLNKIKNYLQEIRKKYGFFSAFFVSSKTKRYYHFKGLHKIIRKDDNHDVWYYRFVESGKEYDLDVDTNEASGNILTIFINFRIVDYQGRLLGVCGVGMKMTSVANLISSFQRKYSRTIYMVDRDGLIQVHSDTSLIEKASIKTMPELSNISEKILRIDNDLGNYSFERGGRDILLTTRYISDIDWLLLVEQDETSSLATARQNFINTILVGFAASLIIIILTIITVNRYQQKVDAMSRIDVLTGVSNRRELEESFAKIKNVIYRHERNFCIILMDLDNFKQVNDFMGHLEGDKLLRLITEIIRSVTRPDDLLVRWGGDEFVVLTENSPEGAALLAERIRKGIADSAIPDNSPANVKKVTISCGIVKINKHQNLDNAISQADILMYRCKSEGGNRVLNG